MAADLMKADEDPRPVAPQLLDRAIAQLPPGVGKIRCRWDAGYFAADLAKHCIDRGVEFAIGVKRNSAVVRAGRVPPTGGWHPAKDMDHTEEPGSRRRLRWSRSSMLPTPVARPVSARGRG